VMRLRQVIVEGEYSSISNTARVLNSVELYGQCELPQQTL